MMTAKVQEMTAKPGGPEPSLLQHATELTQAANPLRDDVERTFDRRYRSLGSAQAYDRDRFDDEPAKRRRDRKTQQAILRTLQEPGTIRTILDIPCGTGRLTRLIKEAGFDYIGADQSEAMLAVAREKLADLPGLRLVTADAARLQFDTDSFDCVVCVRFLNLFPSELRLPMLREMHRVSRRFLLVESRYSRELTWWRRLAAAFSRKQREHYRLDVAFWNDMAKTEWAIHRLHHFKSRGFLSTTRLITLFRKT